MLRTLERSGPARARAVVRAWWPAVGVLLVVLSAAAYTGADADLWGHLRFGLDLIESGRLEATDPYSFTQDRPWVNHEWLSEAVTALAWRVGGTAGLATLKALLAVATLWLIWSAMRGTALWLRVGLLVLVAFGSVHMTSSLRPQLWTFVAVAVLCRILTSGRASRHWWLPALFAAWANLHGGWVAGLAVLAVWAAADAWSRPASRLMWAGVVAASIAATLLNPYGWTLWAFVAETVRPERDVLEWQPLWTTGRVFDWIPWVAGVGVAIWAVGRPQPHRLATGLVLALLAYGALTVTRIESLFVEAVAILLAPVFSARWPAGLIELPPKRSKAEPAVAAALFLVLAAVAVRVGGTSFTCLPLRSVYSPDVAAGRALRGAPPGLLVSYFDWGQYAIWHLGPGIRVSMDGRRETVYSDARLAEHDAIVDGTGAGLDTLERWRPEYVWLPRGSQATKTWLLDHGYRLAIETDRSFVAVRQDVPSWFGTSPPANSPQGPYPCFPA